MSTSDDESPWINMDGTIKGDSPKTPDINTPEMEKLKSLMNSSPESSVSSTPSRSIKKTDEKFQEKLNEYYKLKEDYDQKLRDAHKMWNNSKPPMSLEKKKENYQNFMMNRKCINCGNGPGGTIFSQSGLGEERKITAICGCEQKCGLNIEIYMGQTAYLPEYIDYFKERVEELKKELTEYKLDLLFNLRDEEVVLTEFRTIKEQLTENLDNLVTYKQAYSTQNEEIELGERTFELFNNLKEEVKPNENNEYVISRKRYLDVMQKHLNNLISTFKKKTIAYKKEPTQENLKANFDFLTKEIQDVQDSIRDEKYHVIYLEEIDNDSKKGFKKQKQMEIFHFNPSRYNIENEMITSGNKITRFEM